MVLLTNANKTIFHAAGHAPGGLGMSGVGLYDLNKSASTNNPSLPLTSSFPRGALNETDQRLCRLLWGMQLP